MTRPPPSIAIVKLVNSRRGFVVPSGIVIGCSSQSHLVSVVLCASWNAVTESVSACVLTGSNSTCGSLVEAVYMS